MFYALQTIELVVDGRTLALEEGQRVELTEMEGTVLAAGGYVERVDENADERAADPAIAPRVYDSGDSGAFRAQRPGRG